MTTTAAIPAPPSTPVPNALPSAGGGPSPFLPRSVTVCSIYPAPLHASLLHSSDQERPGCGFTQYHMPAAVLGSPGAQIRDLILPNDPTNSIRQIAYSTLQVYDSWTLILDTNQISESGGREQVLRPVPAFDRSGGGIAPDLVRIWGADSLGAKSGGTFGISIISGPDPTDDELLSLIAQQTKTFEFLVNQADQLWLSGQRNAVNNLHRLAAKWLGIQNRDWVPHLEQVLTKTCVACAETINALAIKCKHCTTDLVQFFISNQYTAAEIEAVDPHIKDTVIRRLERLSPRSTPAASQPSSPSSSSGSNPGTDSGRKLVERSR